MANDKRSWLDAISVRLRRGPLWATAIIAAIFLLLPFAIAYLQGSLAAVLADGTWRIVLLPPISIVYNLAVAPVFNSSDDEIAARIRPLSQLSDSEYDDIVAGACASNVRNEWLAFGAGVVAQIVLFGTPDTYTPLDFYVQLSFILMFGTMGWILYKAIASTRLSRALSRQPLDIDIFDITPFDPIGHQSLHLVMAFIGGTIISLIFLFTWDRFLKWEDIIVFSVVILVAVTVFFLNMWPAHKLLAKAKKRQVENATQTIAGAYHELVARMEQGQSTAEAESKIHAWAVLEDRLKLTRTWPYNTEMMRRLVITVLSPIAVGIAKIVGVLITSGRT